MKKTIFSLSAAFLLTGALAGCGADNGAVGDNNNDGVRPIGYYSDEDNGDNDLGMNNNGNGLLDNNRGRDNITGNDDALGDDNGNLGYNNGDGLNNDTDNDLGLGNNDNNNNGKIDDGNNMMGNGHNNGMMNNGNNNHEQQAQVIADKLADMNNVENTTVVVTDDNVLVGVKTHDGGVSKHFKSTIRRTVQGVVNNKDIHVTTNAKMYNRIQNVNNNLDDGDGLNEVGSDINGIINDLGDAAKRPFQNNNK